MFRCSVDNTVGRVLDSVDSRCCWATHARSRVFHTRRSSTTTTWRPCRVLMSFSSCVISASTAAGGASPCGAAARADKRRREHQHLCHQRQAQRHRMPAKCREFQRGADAEKKEEEEDWDMLRWTMSLNELSPHFILSLLAHYAYLMISSHLVFLYQLSR